jgi:hypothetical protein
LGKRHLRCCAKNQYDGTYHYRMADIHRASSSRLSHVPCSYGVQIFIRFFPKREVVVPAFFHLK